MADFYPILARAIAGLPDASPQARRAVYERATAALLAQLRSLDPPLGEAEIMRERLALDEAVARVEADHEPAPVDEPHLPPTVPIARPVARDEPARFDDFQQQEPADPPVLRPRVTAQKSRKIDPGHVRTAIVGTGVAIAVAAIAATAIYIHKINPPDPATRARIETPAQPAQTDNAGKLNDRVGDAGANPGRPGGGAAPSAQQGGDIVVAQRAILYTEVADNPQQPRAIQGRVFWRLDSESAGQGRPVETIVRATIEIAESGLTLDFTLRRNTEAAFPASHIIGLRFISTGDPATQGVREVGVPQFKTEEGERGAPLSAINSALGENLFVAALSNVPVEVERNIDLIMNRSWIDVPVRFASGRRGIITFEKGVSGGQTLTDAFGRWR